MRWWCKLLKKQRGKLKIGKSHLASWHKGDGTRVGGGHTIPRQS
jgi:hypothetical protein